ncbi:MAG: tyrosine-type recombinase/integrase, partial [Oscillospiraceae bacterium]
YDYEGNRIKPVQKTVKPPEGYTPKQVEKWLDEQALLFEMEAKNTPQVVDKSMTLAKYVEHWLADIAPNKLSKSTIVRDKQDIERILPSLGHCKLVDLRPDTVKNFHSAMRSETHYKTGKPLSEATLEGLQGTLCSILSDAVDEGYLLHNPAWRTFKYKSKKKEKTIADEDMIQKLIAALEEQSLKYELFFKLIIATGMRRGECCGLRWSDINYKDKSVHIRRNVVKVAHEPIFTKEPKTCSGDRLVYISKAMCSLVKEFRAECEYRCAEYEHLAITEDDYIFRQTGGDPMTPSTFTWRFKKILKENGLPTQLNVHSLRHSNASLLIANGVDVTTVAGLLGHAQPSTTLDIYSHAFDKNKKKAHEELQKGLGV